MIVKTGSFVDWPLWKVQNSREENFLYCAALLGWLLIYLLYYLLPNAQGRICVCKFLSNNNWIVNIFISFGGSVHCYPIIKGLERLVKQMFFFQKKIFTSYKLKRFSFPFNKYPLWVVTHYLSLDIWNTKGQNLMKNIKLMVVESGKSQELFWK